MKTKLLLIAVFTGATLLSIYKYAPILSSSNSNPPSKQNDSKLTAQVIGGGEKEASDMTKDTAGKAISSQLASHKTPSKVEQTERNGISTFAAEVLEERARRQAGTEGAVDRSARNRQSPEELYHQGRSQMIADLYTRFYEQAGLSEKQRSQVASLLLEEVEIRAKIPIRQQEGQESYTVLNQKAEDALKLKLAEILNTDQMALFNTYKDEIVGRSIAHSTAKYWELNNIQYSDTDIDNLTSILHRTRVSPGDKTLVQENIYSRLTQNDTIAIQQARRTLNSEQVTALESYLKSRYIIKPKR